MVQEMNALTIRTATVEDAPAVARIHITSWRSAYAGIVPDDVLATLDVDVREQRWHGYLTDARIRTWVAEVADRAIGFATLGPARDEDADDGDLELYAIYLSPESWGTGAARELMRTLLTEVPETARLTLWVFADNERARHFYRRHGLAPDGVERLEEFSGTHLTEVRYVRTRS
ncbi:GNAT family N-acetyltransferase [Flavimobilis sp. GY10621]|uniref:GNAT family N-acetyltransferase n=1 Tax=Flavimobilis rhizosphaerae TaxID=2775421 RepID=A0ABR9DSN5_9MICO|nr:GNAT family N-acetyltransferase [Flavimobilis rhizosphaerae]MBD9700018.1 GNAT family N-acetyltransferase [Flavimobilis rhizosphaerae]